MHSYAPRASNSGKHSGAVPEGESLGQCCHRLRSATNKSACELTKDTTIGRWFSKETKIKPYTFDINHFSSSMKWKVFNLFTLLSLNLKLSWSIKKKLKYREA